VSDRSNRTRTLRIARQWRSGDDKTIDATRVSLLLNELRLPAIKHVWMRFAERSDKEGWPAARFLTAIAEHEIAERDRRRAGAARW
jgi:DNA replication protein DnaC